MPVTEISPRHVDREFAEACQQTERDEVVEGDDRGGARRQDVLGGAISVLDLRPARDVEHVDSGVPGDELGEPATTESVGVGLRRAGEVGDARVAERHEMLAERADRMLVVDRQLRRRVARDRTVHDDDRARAGEQGLEPLGGHARRDEHERVAPGAGLDRDLLLVGHAFGRVGHEHAVAVEGGLATQPLQHPLEHRVLEVGDDEGDGVAAPAHEVACHLARRVVQLLDGFAHLGRDRRVDRLVAVQHPGHGRLRDARVLGDLRDRDLPGRVGHLDLHRGRGWERRYAGSARTRSRRGVGGEVSGCRAGRPGSRSG